MKIFFSGRAFIRAMVVHGAGAAAAGEHVPHLRSSLGQPPQGVSIPLAGRLSPPKLAGGRVLNGNAELLGDCCDIYSRTMRDLGSPPHGRRKKLPLWMARAIGPRIIGKLS